MNDLKKEMLQSIKVEAEEIISIENDSEQEGRTLSFINDEQKCNDVLFWYGTLNQKEAEIIEYRNNEIERIKRFTDTKIKNLTNTRNFYKTALEGYFLTCKGKSLSLSNGKIGSRKSPDKVVVENVGDFTKWWMDIPAAGDLMKIVHKPVLKEIKSYIQNTSEVPPGTEYVEGKPNFYVKPSEE